MSDITDLNPLSPTGNDPVSDGDNELRALKNALVGDGTAAEGSFTPSFTGQYTGTADELNAVNTAIQPTDDLDALSDVTYSPDPPAVGDHLVYGASGWANETPAAPAPSPGSAIYNGYAGGVGNQVYFTTEASNTIPASLATVKNDATGGFGWTLTAATDIVVTLNFTLNVELDIPTTFTRVDSYLGIGLNTVGTSLDQSVGNASADNFQVSPVYDKKEGLGASTAIVLSASDYLTVSYDSVGSGSNPTGFLATVLGANLNLSVQPA